MVAFRAGSICASAVCLLFSGPAAAVITADGSLPALPSGLDLGGVGLLTGGCSAALLEGGQYLLASAHCAAAAGSTVVFMGGTVSATIESTVLAPGFTAAAVNDLSISRLTAPVVGISGYTLSGTLSLPTAVVLAGYGLGGSGSNPGSAVGGVLRWGFNDYEELLADEPTAVYNGTVVAYDFDGGAATNLFGSTGWGAAEAGLALGDSGGPSFALLAGQWQLVGIHAAVADGLGFGYGSVSFDTLVSSYVPWVQQVTAVPEPGPGVLWLAGLLGVAALVRWRC